MTHGEILGLFGQVLDGGNDLCDVNGVEFDLGEESSEVIGEAFQGLCVEVECDETCPHGKETVVEVENVANLVPGDETNDGEAQDPGEVQEHGQEIVHVVHVEVLGHGLQNEVDVYHGVMWSEVELHHELGEKVMCVWKSS